MPPEIFLKYFPFELDTQLIESTKTVYKDSGDIQVHLVYYSKKAFGDTLATFKNYLNKKIGQLLLMPPLVQFTPFMLKKDKTALNILMIFDQTGTGLKIDINYLIYS